MPNNLTDVNAFTSPVVVPAGSDDAGLTYLLTAFQALANRTHYLNEQRAAHSLQVAYDISDALSDSPTIDVAASELVIGGTTEPDTLTVTDGSVEIGANLTFDASDFDVTNGTSGSHALIHVSGAGAQLALSSDQWSITPPFDVAGTNASSGDIGDNDAFYVRVGNVVTFSLGMVLDATGYTSSSYVFRFNPPVTSDFGNVLDVIGTATVTDATVAGVSADVANNLINITFTLSSPRASLTVRAHGQYRII